MSESLSEYLDRHRLLALATASTAGIPHAASAFYANDGISLYFSTAPDSVTSKNLAENPYAAVAIADVPDDWGQSKGVQLSGSVAHVEGDEAAKAANLFGARYPALGDDVRDAPYYRLDANDIRYVDNEQGDGDDVQALGVTWKRNVIHRAFRHLRPDELNQLAAHLKTERKATGETIVEEGSEGTDFYVIAEGQAEATNKEGTFHSVLEPGSFIGEMAILTDEPRTATVTALTDVTLVSISENDLETLYNDIPQLREELEDVMRTRHD
jgi:uncharacterized protein YhbP (UPF0306 family)